MSRREQSQPEEIINAISHGIGILFCLIAIPFLLIEAFTNNHSNVFWAVLVFGIGMLLVYSFSTLYHASRDKKMKDYLQIGDHISIYFFIAGTYSPLMVKYLETETAILFLSVMWSIVLLGTIFKIFFTKKFKFLSTVLYLALGWMIVFVIEPLIATMPFSVFFLDINRWFKLYHWGVFLCERSQNVLSFHLAFICAFRNNCPFCFGIH